MDVFLDVFELEYIETTDRIINVDLIPALETIITLITFIIIFRTLFTCKVSIHLPTNYTYSIYCFAL